MDCRQCSEELTAYIDGELADPAAMQVAYHLEKCGPCDAEFQELKSSAAFVEKHAAELEPVPEIWNNLRSRIAEMPVPTGFLGMFRMRIGNRWTAAAATMAAALILALGVRGYMQGQQSQNELESYMTGYVRLRNITERFHTLQLREVAKRSPDSDTGGLSSLTNPFAEMRPETLANPFLAEQR